MQPQIKSTKIKTTHILAHTHTHTHTQAACMHCAFKNNNNKTTNAIHKMQSSHRDWCSFVVSHFF